MEYNMIECIRKYKDLIENEPYDFIVEEMLIDLKELLLEESKNDITNSTWVIETFFNINHSYDVMDELNSLENKLLENEKNIYINPKNIYVSNDILIEFID